MGSIHFYVILPRIEIFDLKESFKNQYCGERSIDRVLNLSIQIFLAVYTNSDILLSPDTHV